jgi:hypothetical protein
MAKRMSEDEIMDYVYNKVFGDLDNLEGASRFNEESPLDGIPENAKPEGISGVSVEIKPLMAAAKEGPKEEDEEDEDDDGLKGISKMSPLMAQLHGGR